MVTTLRKHGEIIGFKFKQRKAADIGAERVESLGGAKLYQTRKVE